jgi:preprotein translocase subunit SecA
MYEQAGGHDGHGGDRGRRVRTTIYKLDVLVIPTNRPVRRMDFNDLIYKTQREKFGAVVEEISCNATSASSRCSSAPISVDMSAKNSAAFCSSAEHPPQRPERQEPCQREAEIVAQRGPAGAVTIATNMAGRGTDIKLGEGVIYIDRDVITGSGQGSLDSKLPSGEQSLRKRAQRKTLRPPRHRHRAPRLPSHRPPVARSLRAPGRPGFLPRFYISLEDDLMRLLRLRPRVRHAWSALASRRARCMEQRPGSTARSRTAQRKRRAVLLSPSASARWNTTTS